VATKEEFPLAACHFDRDRFAVRVGTAELGAGHLHGSAVYGGNSLIWDLSFTGDAPPLFLFPARLYETALPRAKSLVGLPMAVYNGSLTVNGEAVDIREWVGSQNHNWGTRHTDWYAWAQVAGFDNHPESFLEVASARLKIGPLWTPYLTPLVLRHRGRELRINRLMQTLRARVTFRYFSWTFACTAGPLSIAGRIDAPPDAFVGLRYYNPPGATKHCLNSKIAACELRLIDAVHNPGGVEVLTSAHRAGFEILTDDTGHGIEVRV